MRRFGVGNRRTFIESDFGDVDAVHENRTICWLNDAEEREEKLRGMSRGTMRRKGENAPMTFLLLYARKHRFYAQLSVFESANRNSKM